MQKKTFYKTNLSCSLQPESEISPSHCLNGVISMTSDGFLFEEAVHRRCAKRNPKLYEGKFCSLVHMQNGKYHIHMKTINASAVQDCQDLAFNIYSELLNAFHIID